MLSNLIIYFLLTAGISYSFRIPPASRLINKHVSLSSTKSFDDQLVKTSDGMMRDLIEKPQFSRGNLDTSFRNSLSVFVVDFSMPGCDTRIKAVKRAVNSILPKGKVAVIGCFKCGARAFIPPTSSVLAASKGLKFLEKSAKGNIGAGLSIGLDYCVDSLMTKNVNHATLVVLADGKAHGLRSGLSDCDHADICDLELLQSAYDVAERTEHLNKHGFSFSTVVVDTEGVDSKDLSVEGATLASVSRSHYLHAPDLDDHFLLRTLHDVRFSNSNAQ